MLISELLAYSSASNHDISFFLSFNSLIYIFTSLYPPPNLHSVPHAITPVPSPVSKGCLHHHLDTTRPPHSLGPFDSLREDAPNPEKTCLYPRNLFSRSKATSILPFPSNIMPHTCNLSTGEVWHKILRM